MGRNIARTGTTKCHSTPLPSAPIFISSCSAGTIFKVVSDGSRREVAIRGKRVPKRKVEGPHPKHRFRHVLRKPPWKIGTLTALLR